METTERIVEAYVRYVKGWATIPNIRCSGQYEIDLLAIDPKTNHRYHIEVGVSVSGGFSKLTANPFDPEDLKVRTKIAPTRRTLGYFTDRKFAAEPVKVRLEKYGCNSSNTSRVIVTWGWKEGVEEAAREANVLLWDFRDLMHEISEEFAESKSYFTDDTLRTLNLFTHALRQQKKVSEPLMNSSARKDISMKSQSETDEFWIYENHIHNYARLHRASCNHCQGGKGSHGTTTEQSGRWVGPFSSLDQAERGMNRLGRTSSRCGVCLTVS